MCAGRWQLLRWLLLDTLSAALVCLCMHCTLMCRSSARAPSASACAILQRVLGMHRRRGPRRCGTGCAARGVPSAAALALAFVSMLLQPAVPPRGPVSLCIRTCCLRRRPCCTCMPLLENEIGAQEDLVSDMHLLVPKSLMDRTEVFEGPCVAVLRLPKRHCRSRTNAP